MDDGRKQKCDIAIKNINRNLTEMWYTHNRAIHKELKPKDEQEYEEYKTKALIEISELHKLVYSTKLRRNE